MEATIIMHPAVPECTLAPAYSDLVGRSPVLQQVFEGVAAPRGLADWIDLPFTVPANYVDARLEEVYRSKDLVLVPSAPGDLTKPEFPLPVLQRESELTAIRGRVHQILVLAKVPAGGHVMIACASSGRYHATDLSDAIIAVGYRVSIVVLRHSTPVEMVSGLAPDAVLWTAPAPVPDVLKRFPLIRLTTGTGIDPVPDNHTCVLSYDVASCVAATVDGSWVSLDRHFLVEVRDGGVPLLTSLSDNALPLLRFRPI